MHPSHANPREFHFTLRVESLDRSTRFYSWLLGVAPRSVSSHHSVIVDDSTKTNLVLIASGATEQGSGNIHHLGIGCENKQELLRIHRSAIEHDFDVTEAPHTTWKGTPLHQLWLRDPDGHRIEIYARLSREELARRPTDDRPVPITEDAVSLGGTGNCASVREAPRDAPARDAGATSPASMSLATTTAHPGIWRRNHRSRRDSGPAGPHLARGGLASQGFGCEW